HRQRRDHKHAGEPELKYLPFIPRCHARRSHQAPRDGSSANITRSVMTTPSVATSYMRPVLLCHTSTLDAPFVPAYLPYVPPWSLLPALPGGPPRHPQEQGADAP